MITDERMPNAKSDFNTPGVASSSSNSEAAPSHAHGGQWRSFKTGPGHLQRRATVYVRQSTPHQMIEHGESLARQYAFSDRALAMGWLPQDVEVIDEDLGLSGRGSDERRGFQRLLADVAQNRVGLVLALEVSRLARNSRDWHNLFELCAIRDTLLADEDGVYDPSDVNDRLILGMKGIMSEMELHTMKNRLERGRRNKAERGELFHSVPWGYVLSPEGIVEFDPDEQVRATVKRVFDAFQDLGSGWAVLRHLREHNVLLPKRDGSGRLLWRQATETIVATILHHPIYAGAYSWGRRRTRTEIDPQGRITRRKRWSPPAEWRVLLRDRVPAYITWEQFLDNQRRLRENWNGRDSKGAPRAGSALLSGIVYCGRCGRKMSVVYSSKDNVRFECSRNRIVAADELCGGLIARRLDDLAAGLILQTLSPASVELCLLAVEQTGRQRLEQEALLRQNLQRAAYEAERVERQYQAVEPENRSVARTLESRWETALKKQREAQDACDRFRNAKPVELTSAERRELHDLTRDIPALWHAPQTTFRDRKEIARCMIDRVEVIVNHTNQHVDVKIIWIGGTESLHDLCVQAHVYKRLNNFDELMARIGELRRAGWRSTRIAEQLNSEGFSTARERGPFTDDLVRSLFPRLTSGVREEGEVELKPPRWTAEALARRLNIRVKKLKEWVRCGWVKAIERPFGGVWIFHADEEDVKRLESRAAQTRPGCRYAAEHVGESRTRPRKVDKSR